MAQTSFALMTTLGRAKEAAALANAGTIEITHIAIGDGATVPSGGETALYHEVDRFTISGHGTVVGASNTAYFDCFLAADAGPYTIREAGLIDADGDLVAIARYEPPISKPVPTSGQTVEGTVRLEVAFSDVANISVVVDPSMKVPLQRLTVLPWVPIISMSLGAPPADPAPGDTYIVAADATGVWDGQDGRLAEYTAAGWSIINPPEGHGVSLPDGRVFMRIDGSYEEWLWIRHNLTLTVGSGSADDFATITAAMGWLRRRLISGDATVTIALRAGQHVYNRDIVVDHPCGNRIQIVGAAMSGPDPVFTDFVVTGASAPARAANAATNLTMLRTKYATELRLVAGARLIVIGGGLGLVDDLLITGDGTPAYGMVVEGCHCNFGTVSLHGFGDDNLVFDGADIGIVAGSLTSSGGTADGIEITASYVHEYPMRDFAGSAVDRKVVTVGCGGAGVDIIHGSTVRFRHLHSAGNGVGFSVARAVAYFAAGDVVITGNVAGVQVLRSGEFITNSPTSVKINSNTGIGFSVSGAATASLGDVLGGGVTEINSNGGNGLSVSAAAQAAIRNASISNNGGKGMAVTTGGVVRLEGNNCTVTGNAANGIEASHGAFVSVASVEGAIQANGLPLSPAKETVGNHNSYIAYNV